MVTGTPAEPAGTRIDVIARTATEEPWNRR